MNPRRDRAGGDASAVEQGRIDFLIQRDGVDSAVEWVRRTMQIYRQAVLNKQHFASAPGYRPKFIASYYAFKAWLARIGAEHSPVRKDPSVQPDPT
ncbi:MAG: hypothetical protein IT162_04645 [Bryobacterales bacterium]|nr:hypothetical protein [Bryobacterales bacterium]